MFGQEKTRTTSVIQKKVRHKFVLFMSLFLIVFLLGFFYELYAFFSISNLAKQIATTELPRSRAIQESFKALLEARFSLNNALDVEPENEIEIQKFETTLTGSIGFFNAYLAALTWGSETEAFKFSSNGLNFSEWQKINLENKISILPPSQTQIQLAGLSSIYFGGFSRNAEIALKFYKKFLESHSKIDQIAATQNALEAKRFSNLALTTLIEMANDSNNSAKKATNNIVSNQKLLFFNSVGVFIFIITLLIIIFWQFTKQNETILIELELATRMLVRRDMELSEANSRLITLDESKSEFISVAAHQLRTPLTGIKWAFMEMLDTELGTLNQNQQKIIDDGLKASVRIIEIINDLLNVARIEEGRFGINLKKQSLVDILQKVIKRMEQASENKGIHIKTNISSNVPQVKMDEEKMDMALENLIDNAIKYTAPSGKIEIDVKPVNKNNITILIKDTGIGIPTNQLERVFEKFFRADNALRMQTYGTGLGLYVVKNIIEKHDGTINIKSSDNGTEVAITLPIS